VSSSTSRATTPTARKRSPRRSTPLKASVGAEYGPDTNQ
jgi:hypothetical protein